MPMLRAVNKDFFKKWSPEMAYVLGLFASDGYMWKNKRGGHFFAFQLTDGDLLEKVRLVLGSNHQVSVRRYVRPNWKTAYRIQIGSKEMFDDLQRLGLTQNKTRTLRYPRVPKVFLGDFVRGYFDGDGNVWLGDVHKDRKKRTAVIQCSFTCGSEDFLVRLQECLRSHGCKGGSLFHSQRAWRLRYSVRDSILLYHLMYRRCTGGLFLGRKRKRFEEYIKNAAVV